MKLSPYVSTLHLYDVVSTAGVAADVSHINTPSKASGSKASSVVVALLSQGRYASALTPRAALRRLSRSRGRRSCRAPSPVSTLSSFPLECRGSLE